MVGVIRKRDIVAHPIVTIHCFGWKVFVRALFAPPGTTFLSLVMSEAAKPTKQPWREPIERCSSLELRAKQIYRNFADRFDENREANEFFMTLADQEQQHHDLLQLCSAAMGRGRWKSQVFAQSLQSLPDLEAHMHAAQKTAQLLKTLPEALKLVLGLECSELNFVFQGAVRSSESPFVRRVGAFNATGEQHLEYIARWLPQLEPSLGEACRSLGDIRERLGTEA